jgi:hypothetical protein
MSYRPSASNITSWASSIARRYQASPPNAQSMAGRISLSQQERFQQQRKSGDRLRERKCNDFPKGLGYSYSSVSTPPTSVTRASPKIPAPPISTRKNPEQLILVAMLASSPPQSKAAIDMPKPEPTNITPQHIKDDLYYAPPIQRDERAKHYEGRPIDWIGLFHKLHKGEGDLVEVTLDYPTKGVFLCHCEVRLSDFPQLRLLPKATPIRIVGTLKKVSYYKAGIQDAKLFFQIR